MAPMPLTTMNRLKISTDFTTAPGPRYIVEGKHSGQEFRQTKLLPAIKKAMLDGAKLLIDLDGTSGFGTSFLEEVFGGLIREDNYDLADLDAVVEFKSDEEPFLLDEIREYMTDAQRERDQP